MLPLPTVKALRRPANRRALFPSVLTQAFKSCRRRARPHRRAAWRRCVASLGLLNGRVRLTVPSSNAGDQTSKKYERDVERHGKARGKAQVSGRDPADFFRVIDRQSNISASRANTCRAARGRGVDDARDRRDRRDGSRVGTTPICSMPWNRALPGRRRARPGSHRTAGGSATVLGRDRAPVRGSAEHAV